MPRTVNAYFLLDNLLGINELDKQEKGEMPFIIEKFKGICPYRFGQIVPNGTNLKIKMCFQARFIRN